ncbi:MAG: hypothetical protein HQM01_14470 [Magnetococcales bacterium]|nr:hypothetical protein [Magnetococcales bacterium]
MDHDYDMQINSQMTLAIRLGVQAHLAFRRHSEARIHAIRDGSWLETTSQSVLFRLQAEYDSQQEEYRKALHALRESAPGEYGDLLKEIAQQIREEVSQSPITPSPSPDPPSC